MKQKVNKLLFFSVFIFSALLFNSCQDNFEEQIIQENNNNIHIENISLKSMKPEVAEKINEKVTLLKGKSFKHLEQGKFEYDSILNIFIDFDNGKYISDNEKISYTFPMYRETETKLENVIFSLLETGELYVFFMKYDIEPKDFFVLTNEEIKLLDYELQKVNFEDGGGSMIYTCEESDYTVGTYGGCTLTHPNGETCTNETVTYTLTMCGWSSGGGSLPDGWFDDWGEADNTNTTTGTTTGTTSGGTPNGGSSNPDDGVVTTTPIPLPAYELIKLCLNSPSDGTDNTLLSDDMLDWLQLQENKDNTTLINNFLQANFCIENVQIAILSIVEIMMNNSSTSFSDAFYISLNALFSDDEINEFNWYEESASPLGIDITKFMDCFFNIDLVSDQATYSLTIYVEQPNPNTSDTHNGSDPGHTFISLSITDPLISANNITQTFGYYPGGDVNPVIGDNTSFGEIRNNSGHNYHVSATVSLNNAEFYDIILFIDGLGSSIPQYNLNTYNCTDFCLNIFNNELNGLSLPDSYGSWSIGGINLGRGSNPGNLGQDLRVLNNPNININITTNGESAPASNGECN